MRVLCGIILGVIGYLIWTSHSRRLKAREGYGLELSRAETEGGCLIQFIGVGLLAAGIYVIFT